MSKHTGLIALTLAAGVALAACGGSGGANVNTNTPPSSQPSSGNAVVSVGDAPMSSVLAAVVTVSAVTFTTSSGTAVQLLDQPRQVELTHLGGIREPLVMHALPQGTYTSLSLTVSAAQITYINSSGSVVTTNATIPSANATTTITLSNPLDVNDANATDIRFDFDIQDSLDLTGSTVTFTPQISAAVARVKSESTTDRDIYVDGTVTAVSASANTITLTTDDSGLSVTLNVTSSTKFDDSLSLSNLQTGTEIHTVDDLNSDGSLTADVVEDANGGGGVGSGTQVSGGIITAVTRDANNNLTSFNLAVRNTTEKSEFGQVLTVQVNNATDFKDSLRAQNAGLASFDATSIFAGEGVWVAGTDVQSTADTVLATEVRPAAVSPYGLTSAAVQANTAGNGYILTLLLDNQTNFEQYANITNLTVDTNASTVFDGASLTSANVATLAVGTPLVARGFLALTGSGLTAAYTEYCAHLHEETGIKH